MDLIWLLISSINFITSWKKSDFERLARLGRGSFGVVHHEIEKKTKRHVAIKEMQYETDQEKDMFNKEFQLMLNICNALHKVTQSQFIHVVEPIGFFIGEDGDKAYLVMEFCSNGDMRKYIDDMRQMGADIKDERAFELIGQLIQAINQLHVNSIIHGDVKPENILMTDGFKVKLADFGLARQLQVGREYTTNHGGTTIYLSPEILHGKDIQGQKQDQGKIRQTKAADIYAIGVMIFELLAQKHPFIGDNEEDLSLHEFTTRIINEEPAELPSHYSENLKALIKRMLEKA
ncbi:MAG: putative Serine/threonine protein kinase [Streblomastix strix]|uniref:Putative Serine/threonine protein kinase n=1 Tax=Streblomastix strix TaxID=222440 RepID=A0A5J4UIJ6_9EUKA|nr:MAG: putative Serine/threonine protein kinase [Streblomastix strix]